MSEPLDAGIEDPGAPQRPARRVGRRALSVVAAVLGVLLVAGLAGVVWFGIKSHDASQADEQRATASTVASQFALRMDAVDGTDFQGYIKKVNQLLTTKAKSKNSQLLDVMQKTYQTAKVKGDGKVILTAVGDSDSDSATVLVVHDASVTTSQGKLEHHYRWSVDMVKVGGSWLVDDFNPVN